MPTTKSRQSVSLTPANLSRVQTQMKLFGITSFGAYMNRLLLENVPGFERETEQGTHKRWNHDTKGANNDE